MKPEIEEKYKKDFLVLLTEEYGYRYRCQGVRI
jgi:hypothetical protein